MLADAEIDLAVAAARISELIYANTDFNKYATFFYGVLDSASHHFVYTNAGHNPPFLLRANGEVVRLEVGGLPVGLMPGSTYEQGEVAIGPDDLLVGPENELLMPMAGVATLRCAGVPGYLERRVVIAPVRVDVTSQATKGEASPPGMSRS